MARLGLSASVRPHWEAAADPSLAWWAPRQGRAPYLHPVRACPSTPKLPQSFQVRLNQLLCELSWPHRKGVLPNAVWLVAAALEGGWARHRGLVTCLHRGSTLHRLLTALLLLRLIRLLEAAEAQLAEAAAGEMRDTYAALTNPCAHRQPAGLCRRPRLRLAPRERPRRVAHLRRGRAAAAGAEPARRIHGLSRLHGSDVGGHPQAARARWAQSYNWWPSRGGAVCAGHKQHTHAGISIDRAGWSAGGICCIRRRWERSPRGGRGDVAWLVHSKSRSSSTARQRGTRHVRGSPLQGKPERKNRSQSDWA